MFRCPYLPVIRTANYTHPRGPRRPTVSDVRVRAPPSDRRRGSATKRSPYAAVCSAALSAFAVAAAADLSSPPLLAAEIHLHGLLPPDHSCGGGFGGAGVTSGCRGDRPPPPRLVVKKVRSPFRHFLHCFSFLFHPLFAETTG